MVSGIIFIGTLLWSVINPPDVYMDLWGKYPSRYEANQACTLWKVYQVTGGETSLKVDCIEDAETKQYLGLRHDFIVKRFRF